MFFVYDDDRLKPKKPFGSISDDVDPTEMYMRHYDNTLYLDFFYQRGNTSEKMRAGRELEIARKKMEFWKYRTGFDHERMLKMCEEKKKTWKTK